MIPQSFQSWFAVTQMHLWMAQSRLRVASSNSSDNKEDQQMAKALDGALIDHFTTDIEMKLHQCKVDNVKVFDRYFYQLMSQHYGHSIAYDEGYETGDPVLASALWRNAYSMDKSVRPKNLAYLTYYTRFQMQNVMKCPVEMLKDIQLTAPPVDSIVQIPLVVE
jgi:cytochrome b pre-mRNA-processing protein 3